MTVKERWHYRLMLLVEVSNNAGSEPKKKRSFFQIHYMPTASDTFIWFAFSKYVAYHYF
jgi:hypothetical protein